MQNGPALGGRESAEEGPIDAGEQQGEPAGKGEVQEVQIMNDWMIEWSQSRRCNILINFNCHGNHDLRGEKAEDERAAKGALPPRVQPT